MSPLSTADAIIAFEQGELSEEETIGMFQNLVDSGLAWKLQGTYGRMAQQLIEAGHICKHSFVDINNDGSSACRYCGKAGDSQ